MRKLAVVSMLFLVALPVLPVPAQLPQPGEDWVVDGDTSVSDRYIDMGCQNLTVKSGARLLLTNVSLDFDHSGLEGGITVEKGAYLKLDGCNVAAAYYGWNTYFRVLGELELVRTTVSNIGVDPENGYPGIQVVSGKANITGCAISHKGYDYTYALCSWGSRLTVRDTYFQAEYQIGFFSRDSDIVLDNVSTYPDFWLHSKNDNLTILDSRFFCYNSWSLSDSTVTMTGCVVGTNRNELPEMTDHSGPEPPAPGVNLTFRGCQFNGSSNGLLLFGGDYSYGSGYPIRFEEARECVVTDCYFGPYSNGVECYFIQTALIEKCTFFSNYYGIYATDFSAGELVIRNNTIDVERGMTIEYGEAEISNNTITTSGYYSGSGIYCSDSCRILNNTLTARHYVYYYHGIGVYPRNLGGSVIAGNTIRNFGLGIGVLDRSTDRVSIRDNNISGCGDGIIIQSPGEIISNDISVSDDGIQDDRSRPSEPLDILWNTISANDTGAWIRSGASFRDNVVRGGSKGVDILPDDLYNSPFRGVVSRNTITGNGTGIDAYGILAVAGQCSIDNNTIDGVKDGISVEYSDIPVRDNVIRASEEYGIRAYFYQGEISRNDVSAGEAAIRVDYAPESGPKGQVRDNYLHDSPRGIMLNQTEIAVSGNRFENISAWGIYAVDCIGNLDNNTFGERSHDSLNACRMGRFWSVSGDAKYNINPPGSPEEWKDIYFYDLKAADASGYEVLNRSRYYGDKFYIRESQTWWNGTVQSSNPYTITAMQKSVGVDRQYVTVNRPTELSFYLRQGVDILPFFLNVTPALPVEGDILEFLAALTSDVTYNPQLLGARNILVELALDGEAVMYREYLDIGAGNNYEITGAAVATAGWHNVTIRVDTGNLVSEVFEDNNLMTVAFYVSPSLSASLSVRGERFDAWDPVGFSITPDRPGGIAGYRFDFGDGNLSDWQAAPDTTHVYVAAGQYIARGWVVSSLGVVRECSMPVRVNISQPAPELELLAYPNPARSGQPVRFSLHSNGTLEQVASCTWYFGDDGYSYSEGGLGTDHSYARPGSYSAVLELRMDDDTVYRYSLEVLVHNALPEASGTAAPDRGTAGTPFSFTSSSRDPDGTLLRTRWELGDGTVAEGVVVTHAYTRHGTFRVNLSVQDNQGEWSAPAFFTVTVDNTPPIVSIRPVRGSPAAGDNVAFDGSATCDIDDPPEALAYRWDFGDGAAAEGAAASHRFSSPGRYQVKLTVTDGGGDSSTRTVTVNIRQSAVPEASWQLPAIGVGVLLAASIIIYILIRILTHRHEEPAKPGNGGKIAPKKVRGKPPG